MDSPVALVFGYTWFYCYNPLIDWYKGQILSFQTPSQVSKPTLIGLWLPELRPNDSEPIQPQSIPTGPLLPKLRPTDSEPPRPESPPSSPVTPEVPKVGQPKPSVSFINAAAYARTARVEGSVSFQLSLSDPSLHGRSASTAPILFVKKKDGSLRLCVDFRGLNRLTKKDRYPLPLISDLLDAPGKARIYTKIDLRHAYHLVQIAEGDKAKTTFRTRYSSFEWLVISKGLTNVPSTFQRFMNEVFSDLIDVSVIIYLDDILIYSKNLAEHRKHVKKVLRRLQKHGIFAHANKCEFHAERVEYLGYILSPEGHSMDQAKVKTIQDWPELRKVRDIQSFLSFTNFYRCFVFNYSDIVVPLTRLTRKGIPFQFTDKAREAFNLLKEAFTTAPVLTHWIPDRPIIIETDASDYALAAILSIVAEDGELHPVAFHSRSFSPTELNYDVHDKELFAIYEAFRIWRHYLEGSAAPIDVITDHKNLEYFATTKLLNRRQARWSEYLAQFNLIIRFHPGKLCTKPDALTRRWDVYLKEGGSDYATVNPQNLKPIFGQEQLASSLRASKLYSTAVSGAYVMDLEQLTEDIRSAYPHDPVSSAQLPTPSAPKWSLSKDGMLLLNERLYVPDHDDLRLRVLRYKHDHPLAVSRT